MSQQVAFNAPLDFFLCLSSGCVPMCSFLLLCVCQWERPYMEACVDALQISTSEDVLEIGFGCAYSANWIQSKSPQSHTIIECDEVVLKKAREWAASRKGVTIVAGIWQEMLPDLGVFDAIFFDDFPVPEANDLIAPTGGANDSRWHTFIDLCVNFHMKQGSRITGYLARRLDLLRSDCEVAMSDFEVHPPKNCPYFDCKSLLIPVIRFTGGSYRSAPKAKKVPVAADQPQHAASKALDLATVGKRAHTDVGGVTFKRTKLALPEPKILESEADL